MEVLILHLSDAHFLASNDVTFPKGQKIKEALLGRHTRVDACFIAFSGDIANTGAPDEYAVARRFLNELRSSLLTAGIPFVEIIMIPGNHDCNLRNQTNTRLFMLESLDKFLAPPIDYEGANFHAVMAVQTDFFQLEAEMAGRDMLPESQQLYYRRLFTVSGREFLFHCFNTAWLSRKNEIQSKLYIPPDILTGSTTTDAALSIAMFHHPYNWLSSENYRHLKTFVELQADIILTGHEHEAEASRRQQFSGETMDYIAAPALRDPGLPDNGFQVISCNFDSKLQLITRFKWTGERYAEIAHKEWSLSRNTARAADPFVNSSQFAATLREIGTGFQHPRLTPPKGELTLRDLYVYPDLRHRTIDRIISGGAKKDTIRGEEICNFIEESRLVIIYGADDCGKSSLAKILYEDFRDRRYIPLLVQGEQLKGCSSITKMRQLIAEACGVQYSQAAVEPYFQVDRSRKILFIDDFQKAKLTKKNEKVVLECIPQFFGYAVIFASDIFQFQELARYAKESSGFGGYAHCDVKEFGKYHRNRLIERWLYLGMENNADPEDLVHSVARTDKTISTLLGKNVLPHHPVVILTLLQALETQQAANTANGAYGYLYEVLIKTSLATGSKHGAADVDLKVTYLSGLAYLMFKKKQPSLSREEIKTAHAQYCKRYDIDREFSQIEADLKHSEILSEANGIYSFKYNYIFYYCVAKFFQENQAASQTELLQLADYIYNDTNANILIFYVYLTKDSVLIKHLTNSAKKIYDEYEPCDMESDVNFLNILYPQDPAPLTLPSSDARTNRDDYNRKQDDANESLEQQKDTDEAVDFKYDRHLREAIKINIAFKTLQILGQILRNFPGSLEGQLKLQITRECYELGMRTLRALLKFAEINLEGLRAWLSELISERTGISDRDLAGRADRAILWLTIAAGFGSIKRISYAVGHQELMPTYQKVLAENNSLAIRMIDVAVKLDHFEDIPEIELRRLRAEVKDNVYAYTIMRDIVGDFLYLNSVDYRSMQSLGSQWQIKVSTPTFLVNRAKKS
jgi:hypothetical protein